MLTNFFVSQRKYFLAVSGAVIFAGCSSGPLGVNQLTGSAEVAEGEEARIYWNFTNADRVRIDGFERDFNAVDSLTSRPLLNTSYRIVAFQGSDSLERIWTVRVYQTEPQEIQRGGVATAGIQALPTAEDKSKYLQGVRRSTGEAVRPSILRNVRVRYPAEDNSFTFHTLALDEQGNFLTGLQPDISGYNWTVKYSCGSDSIVQSIGKVSEKQIMQSDLPLNIGVCLERSALAGSFFSSSYVALQEFSASLGEADNVALTLYNQDVASYQLKPAKEAGLMMQSMRLSTPSGLSSVYKAAYSTLNELRSAPLGSANVLVIVSAGSDNSSLIYTAEDIVQSARAALIPVYVIRLGDASESFAMKYISSATGGRYYYLPVEQVSDLPEIFGEIVNSHRIYYEFRLPKPAFADDCPELKASLSLQSDDGTVRDQMALPLAPQENYSKYQAVATFSYRDTVVGGEYLDNLRLLTQTLQDNPGKVIELIGNSSIEGDDDANMMIALRRAQTVRHELIRMGAKPGQIRVRAEGNRRPLYYFQQAKWQEDYNRRVEIRWLDPALLPFEITAALVQTEDAALDEIARWEKRGVRAYYETILYQKMPAFRVKLWGYSSIAEATNAARDLQRRYGGNLSVE